MVEPMADLLTHRIRALVTQRSDRRGVDAAEVRGAVGVHLRGERPYGGVLIEDDAARGQRSAKALDGAVESQDRPERVAQHRARPSQRLARFGGHVHHLAGQLTLGATDGAKVATDVGEWISAALIIILTFAVVLAVRWALNRRDPVRLASDPGLRTRLRLLQRLAMALVILTGLAAAASELGVLDGIANTVLATSAITALIVGLAARATLSNGLAGIILTITQPMRVGDQVRIGEHEGVVQDVTLSATTLRTVLGTTIRVPNETVTQSVVYNDTIDGTGVVPEATVLLPFGSRLGDAVTVALELPGVQTARISNVETDGWNRLLIRGASCAPGDRVPTEARLRLALLEALREAGIVASAPS